MQRVGAFEKVSRKQFHSGVIDLLGDLGCVNKQSQVSSKISGVIDGLYDQIQLPTRATSGSAGYDFVSPIGFIIKPGGSIKIPTGIRVKIEDGWWLGCLPRSGLGFKYRIQLDNTCGVIDSDYYYSENEGHIYIKITNDGKEVQSIDTQFGIGITTPSKAVTISPGDKFMQAIFLPYGITFTDKATGIRDGGIGSTDA